MSAVFTLAVTVYPHARDLDELAPLQHVPGLVVVHASTRADLDEAECIVLPGSADVAADLAWVRQHGLDSAVALHAQARRPVLGLGAGMQLLGEALIDPEAIAGNGPGLGLLPIVSLVQRPAAATPIELVFGDVLAHWAPLSHMRVSAWDVQQGRSVQHAGMGAGRVVAGGGLGWQNAEGNVLGLAARGLFEDAAVLRALFGTP